MTPMYFFVTMDAIMVNAVGTYQCVEIRIELQNAYLLLATMDTIQIVSINDVIFSIVTF